MKKKKLITMLTALVLVGVVGVGATLAYMSSTVSLTNAFTVGNVKITMDETEYLNGDIRKDASGKVMRTPNGNKNTYGTMYPGKIVTKDPLIKIDDNSSDCYLFMQLIGMNKLKLNGFSVANEDEFSANPVVEVNSSWKKLDTAAGVDGIYYYVGSGTDAIVCDKDTIIDPLFNYVKYNNEELGNVTGLEDVVIKACAYQADEVDFDDITTDTSVLFK